MWKHFNIENLKLPITSLLYTKFFNSQALNIHSPKLIAMKLKAMYWRVQAIVNVF